MHPHSCRDERGNPAGPGSGAGARFPYAGIKISPLHPGSLSLCSGGNSVSRRKKHDVRSGRIPRSEGALC